MHSTNTSMLEGSTRFQVTSVCDGSGLVLLGSAQTWQWVCWALGFRPLKYLCNIFPPVPMDKRPVWYHRPDSPPQGQFLLLTYPQATGSLQLRMWSPSVSTYMHPSAKRGLKLSATVSTPSWPHSSFWTSGEDPNSAALPIFQVLVCL